MSDMSFKSDTAKKRFQQVIKAIDTIAQRDQLAFITTKRVSIESGISDGVLFRLFSSKELMLQAWLDARCGRCCTTLKSTPVSRSGLHALIQRLLNDSVSLSFLFCAPMDTPYLRQQLEQCRVQFRQFLHTHITLLYEYTETLSCDAMTDHLIQSMYRAWTPENPTSQQHKEKLMSKLPWEKETGPNETFPSQEITQRLALNDSGFVFDPESGRSFTANAVGLYILRFLQEHQDTDQILDSVLSDFDVDRNDAERDITEFAAQLRKLLA
jgi:AcrR family transcriptional regulator